METKTETSIELASRGDFQVFAGERNFEAAQRMAKVLAASKIVPDGYHGNLADCVIALEMANRIGASPLAVMQNLYIVYGRPAWSSQFLISCINASGKFSPLRYAMTGEKTKDSWGCFAWAVDKSGERLEGPEVTVAIAKAEGWFSKNGSKWKTMPGLMLRYRAATLFARLYAPELTMGIQCDDEVIDITPVVTDPAPKKSLFEAAPEKPAAPPPEKAKTLAEALTGAPVSEKDIRDYYKAKNQAFYEKNVLENLEHIIVNVLDWKEAEAEARKSEGKLI